MANLVFDERERLRQLVNVYVDGVDVREHDGMDTQLTGSEEIRLVALSRAAEPPWAAAAFAGQSPASPTA